MQPVVSPELVHRIHDHKVQMALERQKHQHVNANSDRLGGNTVSLRRRLGRWLIAAGTRVAQERRPATRSLPTGGVAIAGSNDR